MSNWDTSLRRFAESDESEYIEICKCHEPDKFLRFDVNEKNYYGACGCHKENVCARLQINKHKVIITSKKRRLLDPLFAEKRKMQKIRKSSNDQTLDKFFAK